MLIRNYNTSDQEKVVKVWFTSTVKAHPFIEEQTWASHTDELRNKYLPNAETWVAEENGEVVAFISLMESYIGGLFILPDRQGTGIGTKLINKAMEVKGCLTVGVYKKNEKAKGFYEKCGFVFKKEEIQEETGEIIVNMVYPAQGTN